MIPIYLCDDDSSWLELIENSITAFQVQSDWPINVVYRSVSAHDTIAFIRNHKAERGIFFLDIDFKEKENGLDLAECIREYLPGAVIAFVTAHGELVMETFHRKLTANEFIIKNPSTIKKEICSFLAHLEQKFYQLHAPVTKSFSFTSDGNSYRFSSKDIYYLESIKDSHKIRLYLHAASYDFTSTLQDARQQLGSNFIQCHKSCVVNLLHISRLIQEGHKIQLDNGVICSCATRSWKTVKDRYLQSYQAKL